MCLDDGDVSRIPSADKDDKDDRARREQQNGIVWDLKRKKTFSEKIENEKKRRKSAGEGMSENGKTIKDFEMCSEFDSINI